MKWTKSDIDTLLTMNAAGNTTAQIAEKLSRSIQAIRIRASRIGVSLLTTFLRKSDRVGRLTLLEQVARVENFKTRHKRWLCRCDCGNEVVVPQSYLEREKVKSCGCGHDYRHGLYKTSTYRSWQSMKTRCNNENDPSYPNYGGRGIRVCDQWNSSFENFYVDMGERPDGTSLERKRVNEGYFKENCKWATPKEQANNKRKIARVENFSTDELLAELNRKNGSTETAIGALSFGG
jgi:hypothetical protein